MTGEILSAIKLEDAFFCLNCEAVTDGVKVCPVCGKRQLWPLQNWIGRVGNRENSRYGKSAREEFQPATQKIDAKRAEGAIFRGLSMFRKKVLCWG
jgi:RNA polymerase subunit RPABC4/transcription elongation factor Spt4